MRIVRGFLFIMALVLSAGFARAQVQVATFQQGVNNYTNCKSVVISDQTFNPTPGAFGDNGLTVADGNNDFIIGNNNTTFPSVTYYCLLRFDNLNLSNTPVLSATLTLSLSTSSGGARVTGRYLNQVWHGEATTSGFTNRVGWRYRDKNTLSQWGALGATHETNDVATGKYFIAPSSGSAPLPGDFTMHSYTTPLDVAKVQQWIDTPSTNHGVKLLIFESPGVSVSLVQPQRAVSGARPVTMHPMLTITYGTPPSLRITLTNSNQVRLAWPTNGGFVLQQAATATATFTNSTATPLTEGTNKVVYETIASTAKFYRLRLPP